MTDGITHPGWIWIFRKLAAIHPDGAPVAIMFEEHHHPLWELDDFKRLGDTQKFRNTIGVASEDGVVFFAENDTRTNGRNRCIPSGLCPGCHRWFELRVDRGSAAALADPHSLKITPVESRLRL